MSNKQAFETEFKKGDHVKIDPPLRCEITGNLFYEGVVLRSYQRNGDTRYVLDIGFSVSGCKLTKVKWSGKR